MTLWSDVLNKTQLKSILPNQHKMIMAFLAFVVAIVGATTTQQNSDTAVYAAGPIDGLTVYQGDKNIGCGATVVDLAITPKWNANTESDFDHYVYQADTDQREPYDYTVDVTQNSRPSLLDDTDGTYSYRIASIDTTGNQGSWSEWCSVTLDRSNSEIRFISPTNGQTLTTTSFRAMGAADDEAGIERVEYLIEEISGFGGHYVASVTTGTANGTRDWSFPVENLPGGYYRLQVEVFDNAGSSQISAIDISVPGPAKEKSSDENREKKPRGNNKCTRNDWKSLRKDKEWRKCFPINDLRETYEFFSRERS